MKFEIRKKMLGNLAVWCLTHPRIGVRYFLNWDGAIRYMNRRTR